MKSDLTIEQFKAKVIEDGIASVYKREKRPERIKGCLAGFELCKTLNSMADFEECLEERRKHERDMISMRTFGAKERKAMNRDGMTLPEGKNKYSIEDYWEYRCATAQVEFLFERMLVVWSQIGLYSGPLSCNAVLQTAEIVSVAKE